MREEMVYLTPQVHGELRLLYQNAVDNIEYCKKRQWLITSQTIPFYGVLLIVDEAISDSWLADSLFIIIAIIFALYSAYLIRATHASANGERKRLDHIERLFSPEFSIARQIKTDETPDSRRLANCIKFAQWAVVVIGLIFFAFICVYYK